MIDDTETGHDDSRNTRHVATHVPRLRGRYSDDDSGEAACAAFGYLRGIRERAAAIEIRFLNGNRTWFPYTWLGTWQFNPSEGLLLKFTGDTVYLVLIRGSNLDQPLAESATNLMSSGLQRHRIIWMREMGEEEVKQVGETGPTIDSIEIAEFESQDAIKKWLHENAPLFVHCKVEEQVRS